MGAAPRLAARLVFALGAFRAPGVPSQISQNQGPGPRAGECGGRIQQRERKSLWIAAAIWLSSNSLSSKAASLRGRPVFPLYCVFLRHQSSARCATSLLVSRQGGGGTSNRWEAMCAHLLERRRCFKKKRKSRRRLQNEVRPKSINESKQDRSLAQNDTEQTLRIAARYNAEGPRCCVVRQRCGSWGRQ